MTAACKITPALPLSDCQNAERLEQERLFLIHDQQLHMNITSIAQGSPVCDQIKTEEIMFVGSPDGRKGAV